MISVIILAYSRLEHTKKCLESIITRTYETPYELVLVYNAGNPEILEYFYKVQDSQKEIISTFPSHPFKNVQIQANETNVGLQPGRNQGMQMATGDYMMWLDNDAWVEDDYDRLLVRPGDWIRRTDCLGRFVHWMQGLQRDNKTACLVGQTGGYWGPKKVDWRRRCIGDLTEVDALMGYNIAFPREVYDTAGPIDSYYGIRGRQDTEFCFNAKYHGFKCFRNGYFGIAHDWNSQVTDAEKNKKFLENTKYMVEKWNKPENLKKLHLVPKKAWIYD